MSKQAQVGIFSILGLAAVFAVFYVISDIGTRAGGYKVGVHFKTAQGLRQGAVVYLSGVPVGGVDQVRLQPDFTTDVIMAIKPGINIPQHSKYVIVAPITGEPALDIVPLETGVDIATVPHEVQPIDQQPQGTNPQSISELLEQGSGEVQRVDSVLAQLQSAEPKLLRELDATLRNANSVTINANQSLTRLSSQASALTTQLSSLLSQSGGNVNALTTTLNATARRDSPKIDALFAQLQSTSKSLGDSVDSLRSIAVDPQVKTSLKDTTKNFALTSKTLAELTNDLRQVTGNQQTQLQLRDTVANLDATSQKVNSLISQVGGTSEVYGVDTGATPLPSNFPQPVASSAPPLPGASPVPGASPLSGASVAPGSGGTRPGVKRLDVAALKSRISGFTKDLVRIDVRISELAPLRPGSQGRNEQRLLSPDRGPQSDFNLTLLPRAATSFVAGVNDTGGPVGATANVLLEKNQPGLTYGGGVLYSQAGLLARFQTLHNVGLETRVYDLRHPTLDAYLNLVPNPKFELFGGARDLNHADRRAVLGLQFGF